MDAVGLQPLSAEFVRRRVATEEAAEPPVFSDSIPPVNTYTSATDGDGRLPSTKKESSRRTCVPEIDHGRCRANVTNRLATAAEPAAAVVVESESLC